MMVLCFLATKVRKWQWKNNPTKTIHFHVKEPASSNPRETNFRRWWFCLKQNENHWTVIIWNTLKLNKMALLVALLRDISFFSFINCILHSCCLLVQFVFPREGKGIYMLCVVHPHSNPSIASWSSFSTGKKKQKWLCQCLSPSHSLSCLLLLPLWALCCLLFDLMFSNKDSCHDKKECVSSTLQRTWC